MHVRAYNYWVALLEGRDFPSIEDLEPDDVQDFSGHSVLLDFTCGGDNPAIPYIGAAIRDECALDDDTRTIADVPSRSLLSRLTDHYMQIIANRAPVGFEAEFENPRGDTICYRGILMPFSSDGEIDRLHLRRDQLEARRCGAGEQPFAADGPVVEAEPVAPEAGRSGGASPSSSPIRSSRKQLELKSRRMNRTSRQPKSRRFWRRASSAAEPGSPAHFSWEDGPLHEDEAEALPTIAIDENAGLADRLCAARETAETVKAGEGRTRAALYQALSLAYDFALAARDNPQEYAELLEELGVKAQVRAPMTPIVKLVFGIDYDKARLTEFAAALSYAQRQELAPANSKASSRRQPGGLKALVAAERQARRPEPRPDTKGEAARAKLRSAPIHFARRSAGGGRVRGGGHPPRRRWPPRAGRDHRGRSADRTRDPPAPPNSAGVVRSGGAGL